jgi:hypothetical protein
MGLDGGITMIVRNNQYVHRHCSSIPDTRSVRRNALKEQGISTCALEKIPFWLIGLLFALLALPHQP